MRWPFCDTRKRVPAPLGRSQQGLAGLLASSPVAALEILSAAAAERGFGVLHVDRHFDVLAQVLGFESVRLDADAP